MLDLSSGLPYYFIRNGLPYAYPSLQRALRCDVAIIGSGITGALCAHACASEGLSVVLVDSREISTGSTAASTALLQYELDTPLHVLEERIGREKAVRAYRTGVTAVGSLIDLADQVGERSARKRSSLQLAKKRSHEAALRKEFALRKSCGLPCELLEREKVRSLFDGSGTIALRTEEAGELDPYAFTHLLLQEVLRLRGQVFERTLITKWERSGEGFVLRTASAQRIDASHLVLATGYESQRYLKEPLLQLSSTYAVASTRIDGNGPLWSDDSLLWETGSPYLYLRTTRDRRAIIGGLDEPFKDPRRRDALLAKKTAQLKKAFHQLLPYVPFEPAYAWCGTFGSTQDGLPHIDKEPGSGAWFVLGMGGNGITFSWTGANIVRDAILGRDHPDADLFRFGR